MATGSAAVTTLIEREASPIKRLKRFLSRYFYLCMALVMAGVAAAAFGHTVDAHLLHANPPRPPLLWFHAAVFSAWIVLFVAQSALVRVRKVSVHRALGWFGAALAATMVVSGVIVSVVMLRFEITVLHRETAAKFLPVLWCDMIIFGACMALAIYFSEATRVSSPFGFHGQLPAYASHVCQISLHRLSRPLLSGARRTDCGWNVARPRSGWPS